jgi:drug/metabolite transporter (DMT)-like permease
MFIKYKVVLINYVLLFCISLLWGSQFLLNEIVIPVLPPLAVACYRVIFAALFLTMTLFLLPANYRPSKKYPLNITFRIMLIALFEAVIPFFAIAWGQQYSTSSNTAILIGTIPLFTLLLVGIFVPSEKIQTRTTISILLGFLGLITLLYPQINVYHMSNLYDEFAILLGAFCFAITLVLIRGLPPIPSLYLMQQVLTYAAIPMTAILVIFYPQTLLQMSLKTLLAVAGLGIFCSGMALVMYAKLIERTGATFTSLCNYLVPLIGTMLGVTILHETFQLNMIIAMMIILSALGIGQIQRRSLPSPSLPN